MINDVMGMLKKDYSLSENVNEKFEKLKVNGMNFTVKSYKVEGLGWFSYMQAIGMFGLMKMDMLMINPFEKDAPLLSYDRIWAFGNDTMIMELYDTTLNHNFKLNGFDDLKKKYANLPFYYQGEHWYDDILLDPQSIHIKAKKKNNAGFDELALEFAKEYIASCKDCEVVDAKEKIAKAKQYTDGLLNNGGPSTDIFVKKFGKEFTGELFAKVLFGTGE